MHSSIREEPIFVVAFDARMSLSPLLASLRSAAATHQLRKRRRPQTTNSRFSPPKKTLIRLIQVETEEREEAGLRVGTASRTKPQSSKNDQKCLSKSLSVKLPTVPPSSLLFGEGGRRRRRGGGRFELIKFVAAFSTLRVAGIEVMTTVLCCKWLRIRFSSLALMRNAVVFPQFGNFFFFPK